MLVGMEVDDEEEQQQQQESSSYMDDFNRNCTLSTKQRLYGFAICLSAGITCTLLSMLVFFHPVKFGITFSLGNLLALGSTAFLIGPKRQFTMMLDPVRIYATAMYIASIIIALFVLYIVFHSNVTGPQQAIDTSGNCAGVWCSYLNYDLFSLTADGHGLWLKILHILKPTFIILERIWYSASYIPFARAMVSKLMLACFDTEF
ncbi:hypothetical protein SASPL_155667 [Salvia splendens]|uniref:Vesicle transport protein n=1 Tax=Salvia splendens TaxID=180675 RepID=A0A8X8VY72_SALSN|nr:hypothetical protein SASPL_155667 [Salvia splendens]